MEAGVCTSFSCIGSIFTVALIWGATNPLIRRGALYQSNHKVRSSALPPILRPFTDLVQLLFNWRFFLPLTFNQLASILFVFVVSSYPISLVVPLTNSLALLITTLFGLILGERLSLKAGIGCCLIAAGVVCMLADEQLKEQSIAN